MVIDRIQKLITFNTLIHPNAEHIIHPNAENIVGKKKMLLLSLVVSRAYCTYGTYIAYKREFSNCWQTFYGRLNSDVICFVRASPSSR